MRGVVAREAGAGEERLDAAAASAVARGPRTLIVARRRQRVVSPLSRNRIRAGQQTSIDDDAAAGAGADDHAEDDVRACSRAVGGFRKGEAVRVVRETDRAIEQPRQIL